MGIAVGLAREAQAEADRLLVSLPVQQQRAGVAAAEDVVVVVADPHAGSLDRIVSQAELHLLPGHLHHVHHHRHAVVDDVVEIGADDHRREMRVLFQRRLVGQHLVLAVRRAGIEVGHAQRHLFRIAFDPVDGDLAETDHRSAVQLHLQRGAAGGGVDPRLAGHDARLRKAIGLHLAQHRALARVPVRLAVGCAHRQRPRLQHLGQALLVIILLTDIAIQPDGDVVDQHRLAGAHLDPHPVAALQRRVHPGAEIALGLQQLLRLVRRALHQRVQPARVHVRVLLALHQLQVVAQQLRQIGRRVDVHAVLDAGLRLGRRQTGGQRQ